MRCCKYFLDPPRETPESELLLCSVTSEDRKVQARDIIPLGWGRVRMQRQAVCPELTLPEEDTNIPAFSILPLTTWAMTGVQVQTCFLHPVALAASDRHGN